MSNVKNQPEQTNIFPVEVDIERYILGAMLCRNGEVVPKVTAALTAEDFFNRVNRTIFETIVKVHSDGKPVSTLTVFTTLQKTLKSHETLSLISALPEFVHTLAYVDGYIKILKETTRRRLAISTAEQLVINVRAGVSPSDETFSTAVNTLANLSQANNQSNIFDTADDAVAEFNKFAKDMVLYAERKTGFKNLDELQKFTPGLYAIGAIPAAGKTTFCWQMAEQLALQGEHCFYFTYEIGRNALWGKSIARQIYLADPRTFTSIGDVLYRSQPDSVEFYRNMYHLQNFTQQLKNVGGKLTIVECTQDFTVENIMNTISPFIISGKKAPIVFIDYLQKIKSNNESVKNGVDDIVRKLKYHQRQTNTTFVVISSFNRMSYYQRVALESFKESGGIEYEADVVWGMQLAIMEDVKVNAPLLEVRQAVEEAKRAQPRIIQLKCLKYRDGSNYDCIFDYYSAHSHFQPNYDWRSEADYKSMTNIHVGVPNNLPEDDD